MSQIAEQKCPACGAPLRFDPASGKLVCDYCGTTTEVKPEGKKPMKKPGAASGKPEAGTAQNGHTAGQSDIGAGAPQGSQSTGQGQSVSSTDNNIDSSADSIEGFDFANITDSVTVPDASNLPVYNCVSCGAEVIAPSEQVALTCPYCGNNIVLTDKVSGKLRPDGVIPFRIQAKDLPDAVNHFYRDKKLLPRRFFSESTMSRVTGVYVPFWVFNGRFPAPFSLTRRRPPLPAAGTISSRRRTTIIWCAKRRWISKTSPWMPAPGSKTA